MLGFGLTGLAKKLSPVPETNYFQLVFFQSDLYLFGGSHKKVFLFLTASVKIFGKHKNLFASLVSDEKRMANQSPKCPKFADKYF